MQDTSNIKVVVAAHKPYWMPNDPMYIPLQVGAANQNPISGFLRDDTGDNISAKNPRYCELTALYWAWKNLDADYIGLSHYRRHFAGSGEKGTLTRNDAAELLKEAAVILPRKRHYFISTVESHYADTFVQAHIDIVREVLSNEDPVALRSFNEHMKERSAHIWNMLVMRSDIYDAWCNWLFPILEEIEKRIDFDGMTPFEERAVGRLSERLLDPWIVANSISYVECKALSLEPVNWQKKIGSFLKAKIAKEKYTSSF